jgi:hypothetical protein
MRSVPWVLGLAAWLVMSACRLDLSGDSQNERADGTSRDAEEGPSAEAGGPAGSGESDDSGLSCATAAILRTSRELTNDLKSLSGAYHVTGQRKLTGEISIAPGTIFIVDADSGIEFGSYNDRTTLTARGTVDAPIRFCSDRAILGRWFGLSLAGGLTSDSVLQHAHIFDAGSESAALIVNAPIRLVDVTVHGSPKAGVSASAFGEGSSALKVQDVQGAAVVLTGQSALTNFPVDSVFTDNADNVAHVQIHKLEGMARIPNIGLPYLQEDDLLMYDGTLEVEAGVEYRFAVDTFLDVGFAGSKSTLYVNGTAAAPVVLRGAMAVKGAWGGVFIRPTVSTDSVLSNVQLLHGGAGMAPLEVTGKVLLENVTIADCAQAPFIGARLVETSANLTVQGSDGAALTTNFESVHSLPRGGTFVGNARDVIEINSNDAFAKDSVSVVPNLGVPYYVTHQINLGEGADTTIEPGVELIFQTGTDIGLNTGWAGSRGVFRAQGTAAQPIIFRGEVDDVGTWKGILVEDTTLTTSVFDFVEVRNAGLRTEAAVTITNSTFSKSPGFGIEKARAIATDYAATNTFVGNTQDGVGEF